MESFKIFMMPRFGLCKEKILLTPNQSIQRLRCDHKVKGLWHLNVSVKFTKQFSWSILLSSNKSPRTCERRSWLNNEVRCNSESKLKLRNIKKKSPKPLPVNHKSVFLSHIFLCKTAHDGFSKSINLHSVAVFLAPFASCCWS